MCYSFNPATSVIDRVRLMVGDTDTSIVMLDDNTYQYLLDKHNNNEKRAAIEAMQYILFALSRKTRERAGELEVYGGEVFNNYEKALKLMLSNPELYLPTIVPYAGGISRQDMEDNDNNTDNVDKPFFMGFGNGFPSYRNKTLYYDTGRWS